MSSPRRCREENIKGTDIIVGAGLIPARYPEKTAQRAHIKYAPTRYRT